MKRVFTCITVLFLMFAAPLAAQQFERDTIKTSVGEMTITFIGHGTLMFSFDDMIIHVDPVSQLADYTRMPTADLILITHEHGDHLDLTALEALRTGKTTVITPESCANQIGAGIIMKKGDVKTIQGIAVEAIPAYNIVHMQSEVVPFHPKGVGNGYVLTFGNKRVYVAGDTENTPEMKQVREIDIAFLPMNLPYTMTPEMVADAARAFKPKILYPYHYGSTDTSKIMDLLKGSGTEVRIRNMK